MLCQPHNGNFIIVFSIKEVFIWLLDDADDKNIKERGNWSKKSSKDFFFSISGLFKNK